MTDQTLPAPHPSRVGELFNHSPVKRLEELRRGRPAQTGQMRVGWNGKIGLFITGIVGTMWAAYIFTVIALISLPSALSTGNIIIIISWIAQTFLQLVLLPIIIVGQNIQGAASDKRAADTYKDAEAILEQCVQLQQHLMAQDKILDDVLAHLHEEAAAAS
ncbi:MAG TPA: hypothetical protein VNY76_08845 [Candidatus Acidoferrales bacterium]|jgi:hypothetical protein|nr:hypothetical protein [Candidatus Acidoferrales bacterium]